MSGFEQIESRVGEYFDDRLTQHGATAEGAAWATTESQSLRFNKLLGVIEESEGEFFTINDYGCGYGALADHLSAAGLNFHYSGYDISPAMARTARERLDDHGFHIVSSHTELTEADYTVASGVFNLKLEAAGSDWECLLLDTLDRMAELSRRAFGFNCLERPVDAASRRSELYYADPHAVFEHCRSRFSQRVAVLADYNLPEFTVIVRK